MNKYIKTDLRDSVKLMKIAIMNALNDIETGEETKINLGCYVPQPLFLECLQEAKWEIEIGDLMCYEAKTPSGKKVLIDLVTGDCILSSVKYIPVTISMCLSSGQEVEVPRDFDENDEQALKEAVKDQIFLPTDALEQTGFAKEWDVDDFAVI